MASAITAAASLDAAAKYLGLTEAELHTQLESGKTLAEIAKAQGKTVDGLKKALTDATKTKLDAAVKAGTITQAQADELLKRATEHLDDLVNGTFGPHGDGDHHGFGRPPLTVPGGGVRQRHAGAAAPGRASGSHALAGPGSRPAPRVARLQRRLATARSSSVPRTAASRAASATSRS